MKTKILFFFGILFYSLFSVAVFVKAEKSNNFIISNGDILLQPAPLSSDNFIIDNDSISPELQGVVVVPTCGDGIVEDWEVCDTTNVGKKTCEDFSLISGTLACSSNCIDYDISECIDQNTPPSDVDTPLSLQGGGGWRRKIPEKNIPKKSDSHDVQPVHPENIPEIKNPEEPVKKEPITEIVKEEFEAPEKKENSKLIIQNAKKENSVFPPSSKEQKQNEEILLDSNILNIQEQIEAPEKDKVLEKTHSSAPNIKEKEEYEFHLYGYLAADSIETIDPTPLIAGTLEPETEYEMAVFTRWNELIETKKIYTNRDGLFVFEGDKILEDGIYHISIYTKTDDGDIIKVREYPIYIKEEPYKKLKIFSVSDIWGVENNFETPVNIGEIVRDNPDFIAGHAMPFAKIYGYFENGKYMRTASADKNGKFLLPIPKQLFWGKQKVQIIQEAKFSLEKKNNLHKNLTYYFELVPEKTEGHQPCPLVEKETFSLWYWPWYIFILLLIIIFLLCRRKNFFP